MNTAVFLLLAAISLSLAQPFPKLNGGLPPHVTIYPVNGHSTVTEPPTTTTLPPTTTTEPPTKKPVVYYTPKIDSNYVLANSPFTCEGLIEGYYADANFDCMFFHQCHFFEEEGKFYVRQTAFECGKNTKFNQTTRTCDYEQNVICDLYAVENIIKYQQVEPTPTPGPSKAKQIPKTSFRCRPDYHLNGFYFADEEVQCTVYHRCVYHKKDGALYATQYSFMCPDYTRFNQTTISCMPSDAVHCADSSLRWIDQAHLHPGY